MYSITNQAEVGLEISIFLLWKVISFSNAFRRDKNDDGLKFSDNKWAALKYRCCPRWRNEFRVNALYDVVS